MGKNNSKRKEVTHFQKVKSYMKKADNYIENEIKISKMNERKENK